MTLVEYITDLLSGPHNGPARSGSAVAGRRIRSADGDHEDAGETAGFAIVYECRRCGTTVSAETTTCPRCEHSAIAEYPVW